MMRTEKNTNQHMNKSSIYVVVAFKMIAILKEKNIPVDFFGIHLAGLELGGRTNSSNILPCVGQGGRTGHPHNSLLQKVECVIALEEPCSASVG